MKIEELTNLRGFRFYFQDRDHARSAQRKNENKHIQCILFLAGTELVLDVKCREPERQRERDTHWHNELWNPTESGKHVS